MLAWRWLYIIMFGLCAVGSKAQINTDAVIQVGRNALFYKDYVLAMQYFNKVIDAKPYLYEPYYYRAIAKYYLGDNQGAIDDCTRSIDRDPYIDETYRLRAINLVRTGRFNSAAQDYLSLIRRRANSDRDVWYNLVLCKVKTDDMAEADRYLDSIIMRWPDYGRSYMLKAQIALVATDTLRADSFLTQALAIDANEADAWAVKAQLRFKTGDYTECEAAIDNALFFRPQRADWYSLRGLARYMQHNFEGAISDYSATLQLEPSNTLALYNRALLRMHTSQEALAIADLNRVIALMPTDALTLYNRALCHLRLQQTTEAEADLTKLKALTPQVPALTILTNTPTPPSYRNEDDNDFAKHNYLIAENDNDESLFYASDYRNRQSQTETTMALMPMFGPSFASAFAAPYETSSDLTLTSPINAAMPDKWRIRLTAIEPTLTEAQYHAINTRRTELENNILEGPTTLATLLQHAVLLLFERDYNAAITSLDKCINATEKIDENKHAALYMLRALAKFKKQEATTSDKTASLTIATEKRRSTLVAITKDLTMAINLAPHSAYLYYNRACVYASTGDYHNAIADYTKAIELSPNLAEAYFNRGICLLNSNNKTAAMQDFSNAGERGLQAAYSIIRYFKN